MAALREACVSSAFVMEESFLIDRRSKKRTIHAVPYAWFAQDPHGWLCFSVIVKAIQIMYGQSVGTPQMPVSQLLPRVIRTGVLIHRLRHERGDRMPDQQQHSRIKVVPTHLFSF